MVTFKERWCKLYYIQHTLLSNIGQLPILFWGERAGVGGTIHRIILSLLLIELSSMVCFYPGDPLVFFFL